MRLEFVPPMTQEDREVLKPKVGDAVYYEGVRYIVDLVGLKYVHMHPADNPKTTHIAKITQVHKEILNEDGSTEPAFRIPGL